MKGEHVSRGKIVLESRESKKTKSPSSRVFQRAESPRFRLGSIRFLWRLERRKRGNEKLVRACENEGRSFLASPPRFGRLESRSSRPRFPLNATTPIFSLGASAETFSIASRAALNRKCIKNNRPHDSRSKFIAAGITFREETKTGNGGISKERPFNSKRR